MTAEKTTPAAPNLASPDLRSLRSAVAAFGGSAGTGNSSAEPGQATPLELDPSLPEHRRALLSLLNAWGCRIRYPRPGEVDLFDLKVGEWWTRWYDAMPDTETSLAELTDEMITVLGECYADLAATPVGQAGRVRSLGPTAASKLLYALRPRAVMMWDEAIARRLHGARDAAAYSGHQRLGRAWARRLLAEAGLDEKSLAVTLGCPGRSLAKMLDDYCYLRFTRLESP